MDLGATDNAVLDSIAALLTTIDADTGNMATSLAIIDGLPTSDMDLQQYRKRVRKGPTQSTQLLSNSRLFDTGRLDFAVARDYDPEAQVMGLEAEGVDIAVLYPTAGLGLLARDNLDPQLSLALC